MDIRDMRTTINLDEALVKEAQRLTAQRSAPPWFTKACGRSSRERARGAWRGSEGATHAPGLQGDGGLLNPG